MHNTPLYSLSDPRTTLIVVDPQLAFGEVVEVPDAAEALDNMRRAVELWLKLGRPVICTRHAYDFEGQVGTLADFIPKIYEVLKVGSPHAEHYPGFDDHRINQVTKSNFDCFSTTSMRMAINATRAKGIIVCGLTTPICVEATARTAQALGFEVTVLGDACASQAMGNETAQEAHENALGRMGYVMASVITTDDFIGPVS